MSTQIEASSQTLEKEAQELTFVGQGLLGLEHLLHYTLSAYDPQTPFYWLRARDNQDVAFVVIEPCYLLADYAFDLPDDLASELEINSSEDVFVLVILRIPENPNEMTANLSAPLVFNRKSYKGRQLVLELSQFPLRLPLFPDGFTEPPDAQEAGI
jgi:flagellar assembly factor FliW